MWQYAYVAAQGIAQLAVLSVLSRLLSPADFGTLGAAMIFVGFAALFSQLGVAPALVQRAHLTERLLRVGVTISVLFGFGMVVLLWSTANPIAYFLHNQAIVPVIRGVSFTFLASAIGVVPEALLQRDLRFRRLMWVNLGSYVLGYGLVGILLALNQWGVWALVGATLAQSIVKSGLLLIARPVSFVPSLARWEIRELLHFGIGFTVARSFNYGANQGDYLVVGRVLGAAPLGNYTRAYQLMMLPATYVGQALERVLFPAMAQIQHDPARLSRMFLYGTALISMVVAPISVVMIMCAQEIVAVLLGEQWNAAVAPFQLLSFGILFRTSYKLGDSLAKARGAIRERSIREALYLALVLGGSLTGLRWGIKGVAAGVLIAVFVNYLAAAQMSLEILGLRWRAYAACHVGGVVLAIAAGLAAIAGRSLAVVLGLPSVAILALTTGSGVCASLAIPLLWPQLLGYQSQKTITRALVALPVSKLPPLAARLLQSYLAKPVIVASRR